MTTNPNDDDLENRSKQTEPLPDRETLPPQDESTQEADSSPDNVVAWDETDNGNELYTANFSGLPGSGTIFVSSW